MDDNVDMSVDVCSTWAWNLCRQWLNKEAKEWVSMSNALKSCQGGQISPEIIIMSWTVRSESLSYHVWVWHTGYHGCSLALRVWFNKPSCCWTKGGAWLKSRLNDRERLGDGTVSMLSHIDTKPTLSLTFRL